VEVRVSRCAAGDIIMALLDVGGGRDLEALGKTTKTCFGVDTLMWDLQICTSSTKHWTTLSVMPFAQGNFRSYITGNTDPLPYAVQLVNVT
jgi:hypothetical protein